MVISKVVFDSLGGGGDAEEGLVYLSFGHLQQAQTQALEKLLPCVASGTQGQHG